MKHYEILCVMPGTLSEEETGPTMEKVKSIITAEGGTEISIEEKGKSRLTYPMKHIRYGYFYIVQFQSEPGSVSAIENKLGLVPELLRHLINNFDPQRRADHEERLVTLQKRKAMDFSKPQEAKEEVKDAAPVEEKSEGKEVVEEKEEETSKKEEKKEEKVEEVSTEKEAKEEVVPEPKEEKKEEKKEKVDMDEIGKKLDALLDEDLGNV